MPTTTKPETTGALNRTIIMPIVIHIKTFDGSASDRTSG
jgi:hypothetical protein